MTNTERLIQSLAYAEQSGQRGLTFMVGRYTGNGPAVVAALRRRGYEVTKVPAIGVTCYRLSRTQLEMP
jgi:hypothetical protein